MMIGHFKKLTLVLCITFVGFGVQAQDFTIKKFSFPEHIAAGDISAGGDTVWVATNRGAARFNGFSWEFFDETNGLNIDSIWTVVADVQNTTWFKGYGLVTLQGNKWEYTPNYITGILDNTGDELWLSYQDMWGVTTLQKITSTDTVSFTKPNVEFLKGVQGVERVNGNTSYAEYMAYSFERTYYLKDDQIWIDTTWNYVLDFQIDDEGNRWVLDGGKIFMRKFNSGVYHEVECPLVSEQHFNNLTSDKEGNIYFGTWNEGLFIKTKDTWYHLDSSNGLLADNVSDVEADDNDNIWVSTTNWVPGQNASGVSVIEKDGWINSTNGLSGILYWDKNNDGLQDDDEPGIPNQFVQIGSGGAYAISNNDGVFLFKPVVGENTITAILKDFWEQGATPVSFTFTYPGADLPSFKIGLKWKIVHDVGVSLSGNGLRPGFDSRLYLTLRNEGSVSASTSLELNYDPVLSFLDSSIPPTVNGDGHLEWVISNLEPLHAQTVLVTFNLPPGVSLGTIIKNEAMAVAVTDEIDLIDNIDSLKTLVTGSLDPNDKLVSEGIFEERYVELDSKLTYTIRFQNTGTDTAFVVKIKDEIDPHLDLTSLEILASSHLVKYSLDNRHLNFSFPNIKLPDSVHNEPASHGYVKYRIGPLSTILNNTVVYNSASIYFDFNEPVVTNRVQNKFVVELPDEVVLGVEDLSPVKVIVYPNPANLVLNVSDDILNEYSRAELISSTGLPLREFDIKATRGKMAIENVPSGLYLLRLTGRSKILITKIFIAKDN